MTDSTHYYGDGCPGGHGVPSGLQFFDCCIHCPDDCGAKDKHRWPCNKCQPRVTETF